MHGQNVPMLKVTAYMMFLAGLANAAAAQTTIANPLHAGAETRPLPQSSARSPAQRLAAEDTRACGAEWKIRKAELGASGATWQSFALQCRAKRKSARGV